MLITMPSQRQVLSIITIALIALLTVTTLQHFTGNRGLDDIVLGPLHDSLPQVQKQRPIYKKPPTYAPPPIKDNFPLLQTTTKLPPIPPWNVPKRNLHRSYDLPLAPPLLIGFTRAWPLLLQAVTSYITAGWPASQIYVIENTGVQQANARNQLTLQNPFYLNHTQLKTLGVNIIQTPALLSFAQLQNFYHSLTYQHNWPYFFWSHMDVLAFSLENGGDGLPRYNEDGYKTIYELSLAALKEARETDPRWGIRFFAYDHLALVNPEAYEDVGGWDTMIPYYNTDCDMHTRLTMRGWSLKDARAGLITDVGSSLADLRVLYRVEEVKPDFCDVNPPPPEKGGKTRFAGAETMNASSSTHQSPKRDADEKPDPEIAKFRALEETAHAMVRYKNSGTRERYVWQMGQRGGQGEPFYYNAQGLQDAIEVMIETGRRIYRMKWGHKDCDLIDGAKLKLGDQWMVEKDYFAPLGD
ncbi:hypothetical protein QBC37DRAFT_327371 [Rhypophila decipiens]|uniref:Uncharacterized protein n=1 Tax=Rhypophila decipiens TaxID=261697 RepID=A0AAN6XVL6_9PEZI|nr:hypothetical protein QBC37DRAFT_327371 [Rhypophila decipiens]